MKVRAICTTVAIFLVAVTVLGLVTWGFYDLFMSISPDETDPEKIKENKAVSAIVAPLGTLVVMLVLALLCVTPSAPARVVYKKILSRLEGKRVVRDKRIETADHVIFRAEHYYPKRGGILTVYRRLFDEWVGPCGWS